MAPRKSSSWQRLSLISIARSQEAAAA